MGSTSPWWRPSPTGRLPLPNNIRINVTVTVPLTSLVPPADPTSSGGDPGGGDGDSGPGGGPGGGGLATAPELTDRESPTTSSRRLPTSGGVPLAAARTVSRHDRSPAASTGRSLPTTSSRRLSATGGRSLPTSGRGVPAAPTSSVPSQGPTCLVRAVEAEPAAGSVDRVPVAVPTGTAPHATAPTPTQAAPVTGAATTATTATETTKPTNATGLTDPANATEVTDLAEPADPAEVAEVLIGAHGAAVPAATAWCLAAGGTWRRLVTDPLSGTVIDVGRSRYRPPAGLADLVRARDHSCVYPTCQTPAQRCDIDHLTPWSQGGTTSLDNLVTLCQTHHRLKHTPGWALTRNEDTGVLSWHTPDKTVYQRHPDATINRLPKKVGPRQHYLPGAQVPTTLSNQISPEIIDRLNTALTNTHSTNNTNDTNSPLRLTTRGPTPGQKAGDYETTPYPHATHTLGPAPLIDQAPPF
ncbi:HNH endonuclease [Actinomyces viscosus]|uniref:HNH endonuclease n=2 Tax=Actinomyces viscosus TaxID=1656 RepID=A0A3S4VCM2_ACTVI|nr:HNH endonuclease [Actinomyces viscosus]